jgi:hypothetical protein
MTDAELFRDLLDSMEGEPPALELAERLADARGLNVAAAQDRVYSALDDGVLVEQGDGFGSVRLAAEYRGGSDTGEDGSSGQTPTPSGSEDGEDPPENDGLAAFKDAIRFFNDQVDSRLGPDADRTAREHFRDVRGWENDTINSKLLGWAPPSETALLDHLMAQGYDRDAILGTGLFWDDLSPIWKGRLVLPYLSDDGEPAFAISRSVGHRADTTGYGDGPAKYHKIPGRDGVAVEEPIYGLSSIEPGEPVLVTEGIADAITAHQAGYACVSPVTTTFKKSDRERLAELFEAADVGRVYIVQDAEAPSSTVDDSGELVTTQVGEGLRGALSTAAFLDSRDVEAYIGELPQPGLEKVDLDDYIQEWGALRPVLASAKPAHEHPHFEPDTGHSSGDDDSGGEPPSRDRGSAVFDLDLSHVAGVSSGERTTNPLGHHGDSENYYVVGDDGETAFDHKYKASYTALTHLLVAAGDRDANDPEGELDDRELFTAWRQAKRENVLPSSDPVPYRALLGVAVADGLVDRDELVRRDADTGDVVEDGSDTDTYRALPPGTYGDVLSHIEEKYGVDTGRDADTSSGDDDGGESYGSDPRTVSATVDPSRAWDAAGRVSPEDLDGDRLDPDDDGDGFACPDCGESVDVVRAVAVDTGLIGGCEAALTDDYSAAYNRAREDYGAPLPQYYTTADAVAEFQAVLDVIGETDFWHLDPDALESEVTAEGDDVSGEAVRALNPAWRESESGESLLVFESGTVWDADTERSLDVLRFVALDSGLIDTPDDDVSGSVFTTAYRRAREQYGAPLPRWEPAADGSRDVTPMLPPAEELLENATPEGVDTDALHDARREVEQLIGRAAGQNGEPTVVQALPALGKTTGTVKTARERPLSYLAQRKELQAQALEKARDWGVDARVLPVFSDETVEEEVMNSAVAFVRENGKDQLRERGALLGSKFEDPADVDASEIFKDTEEEEDDVHLHRPTCETADGAHGPGWALAVHVASQAYDMHPSEIHRQAQGLFGAALPCSGDHGDETCAYTEGWEQVRDPDAPADLLVGHYAHAHVESARTYYTRGPDGERQRDSRALVFDEYPGNVFTREFGENAEDHAVWLARCLRDDVADRRDMIESDLWGDEFVRAWLDGEADEHGAVADATDALSRSLELLEAREAASRLLDGPDADTLEELGLGEPLRQISAGADGATVLGELADALDSINPEHPAAAGVLGWDAADATEATTGPVGRVVEDVFDPLRRATDDGTPELDIDTDSLPVAGELRELVESATEAATMQRDDARARLQAVITALTGGPDACRQLAAWANDGYAHPQADHLLQAVITPTGNDAEGRRVSTEKWAFDDAATNGTVLDVVDTAPKARCMQDRNGHGAHLKIAPSRTAGDGSEAPVIGLDATGRRQLWEEALFEEVTTADIHDTDAERAEFLQEVLGLQVLRASDRARAYSGDPESKGTDRDVALLEAIAEEYAGLETPTERGGEPIPVGNPAAITSDKVQNKLEADSRLDDVVSEWEHFGNLTGSNKLGGHRLAAILGSQHYGDDEIEKFCALAGQEVDTSRDAGRGVELDYGNELANTYLNHMREDQVMQAILRFARGDSGATVVAHTSALRDDLPVVGEAKVVETWSDTATTIARAYRRLGGQFTVADVADHVDVTKRQVRRVLSELSNAGYLDVVSSGDGVATVYDPRNTPGAGEVELPERGEVVSADAPGQDPTTVYYTWNVRVHGDPARQHGGESPSPRRAAGAPPAPTVTDGGEPPG